MEPQGLPSPAAIQLIFLVGLFEQRDKLDICAVALCIPIEPSGAVISIKPVKQIDFFFLPIFFPCISKKCEFMKILAKVRFLEFDCKGIGSMQGLFALTNWSCFGENKKT